MNSFANKSDPINLLDWVERLFRRENKSFKKDTSNGQKVVPVS
jgi:hypothetical protein